MKTALIIIDIQNDYFPGGKMELEGSLQASLKAKEVLTYFRKENLPVIHIQHFSIRPGAAFFIPDTQGVEIHENVTPLAGEILIKKNYPNSFRDTTLLDHLKKEGIENLVITGMMTHMCVDATTRAAFDFGFTCTVLQDACATRTLKLDDKIIPAEYVHNAFLSALNSTYAKVIKADELSLPI
jgi:nicotinamidase-related amidase